MVENNATEWILINLKYRGKCIGCGKEITSGRALWSRATKSIKHLDCAVSNAKQASNPEDIAFQEQKTPTRRQYRKTIVQRCFICGKEFENLGDLQRHTTVEHIQKGELPSSSKDA